MVIQSYEYNKNYWAINCIFWAINFKWVNFCLVISQLKTWCIGSCTSGVAGPGLWGLGQNHQSDIPLGVLGCCEMSNWKKDPIVFVLKR